MVPMMNHVAWVVEDQQAAQDFLETHFACTAQGPRIIAGPWAEELSQMKDVYVTYVGVTSPGTETRIALLKFQHPEPEENPEVAELNRMGFRHIGFLVDDIAGKVTELKQSGYKFFSDVVTVEAFKSKTVYFWGPERVVVQLTEAVS